MIIQILQKVVHDALVEAGIDEYNIQIAANTDAAKGDYSTNASMAFAKKYGKSPMELGELLREKIVNAKTPMLTRVEVVKPGFINFWLDEKWLANTLFSREYKQITPGVQSQKFFIEYAHPNTHKEMHIGHMRTLITGEAVARLLESKGNSVFRANYQGDIGLHVAKALYGIELLLAERKLDIVEVGKWSNSDKAHFLGEGYARGSTDYEAEKEKIDTINKQLYDEGSETNKLYKLTRKWSLDYYDDFYMRFYTKFDRLFFESEVAREGLRIVQDYTGDIFEKQNGAIVFPGEKYGLHTRVFITQAGNPTYEGKEMGNAFNEYRAFPFDKKIHVVGNEQEGYFKVVFKALELLDAEKFKDKQHHISMGMVQFADRKMSSRTGDVLRVDWLIDQVKIKVREIMKGERTPAEELDDTVEKIAIGAIKYSVLQVGTGQNVSFNINKSVSLDGNSGPYIQYSYARTQSVLRKENAAEIGEEMSFIELTPEERSIMIHLLRFDDVLTIASKTLAPNVITSYLFELAQAFNLFYQRCPILKSEGPQKVFRLRLTQMTGKTLKEGLHLLGIAAPERM